MNELEIVHYQQMEGLSVFFDTVEYRTAHVHSEWELLWLLDHTLTVINQYGRYKMQPGQLVLFASKEPHEFHKTEEEATFVCLQIGPNLLPETLPLTMEGSFPHLYETEEELKNHKRALSEIVRAYLMREENYKLFCVGKSCLLLYNLLSKLPHHVLSDEEAAIRDKRNARLNRLIQFVDENYMHKIRLSDFAESEGCSMGYLSRFIKKTMNQSFQEYVTKVRFNRACELIAGHDMQLLDVCFESGFSDYRYFSRAFKQQYHMTPEEYRRKRNTEEPEIRMVQRSIHSIERFYSREESLKLAEQYFI